MYNDNTRFIEDIGADELKMQAFFNKVEETFNIKLFDSEKDNCKTVGNLKALLKNYVIQKHNNTTVIMGLLSSKQKMTLYQISIYHLI